MIKSKINSSIILFIISVIFLFWNINGDPSSLRYMGDYGDEGYWLHNSINKVKYEKPIKDDLNQAYFGAPFYYYLNTINFKIFGISLLSARILSITFLLLTGLILYFILRPYVRRKILFLYIAGFLILFDNKLWFNYSTPLSLELFFQSIFILFILRYRLNLLRNVLIASILAYLCVLSKATSVWLIGFAVVIYIYDNYNNLSYSKLGFTIFVFLIPYLLVNFAFYLEYPEKYKLYLNLLSYNVDVNKSHFIHIVNPLYYLTMLYKTFKYPTMWIIFLSFIVLISREYKNYKILLEQRHLFILISFVIVYIGFLFTTNELHPRRIIILVLPLYIMFILCLEYNKWNVFWIYVGINILYHIIFLNTGQSLRENSERLSEFSEKYNINYVTGYKSHQLSIEAGTYPIWYYPDTASVYYNLGYNKNFGDEPYIFIEKGADSLIFNIK